MRFEVKDVERIDYAITLSDGRTYYGKNRNSVIKRLNTEKQGILDFFNRPCMSYPTKYGGILMNKEQVINAINKEFSNYTIYKRITSVKFIKD